MRQKSAVTSTVGALLRSVRLGGPKLIVRPGHANLPLAPYRAERRPRIEIVANDPTKDALANARASRGA